MLLQIQPILGTRDFAKGVAFYTDLLGFRLLFNHDNNYAGFRRDNVEIHMQFQYEHEMQTTRLRFVVDDPDALFAEFEALAIFHDRTHLANTPWGTREFSFYDPDGNGLTFYRHL
ncbi:MAG: VOC family protein [Luteolibacter sp.]|uniref:VOC family protein n=1 Tax=Luteolibacter sp. TaxID=1962973 RepID=UPI0032658C2B